MQEAFSIHRETKVVQIINRLKGMIFLLQRYTGGDGHICDYDLYVLPISLCSANRTSMQYVREGGGRKEEVSTAGDPECYQKSLLVGEGIRLQNKCRSASVLKYKQCWDHQSLIPISHMMVYGRWVVSLILRINGWTVVTEVCSR